MIDPLHDLESSDSRVRWIQRPGLAYLLPMRLSPRNPPADATDPMDPALESIGDARLSSAELLRAFRDCSS